MSERIFIGNVGDKNLKRKMQEESKPRSEKEPKVIPPTSESLEISEQSSLSQNPTIEPLTQNVSDEPLPQNTVDEPLLDQEVRGFLCQYCDKRFPTSQARGGHQNAHRFERAIDKMEEQKRKIDKMNSTLGFTFSNQPYPCPFSSHINYQGYSYLRSANMPYPFSTWMNNPMPCSAIGYPLSGYGGLHMPNTSSTTLQLGMQTLPLLSRIDPVGEDLVPANPNMSSSSAQSTSEEPNLNLTL